MTSADKEEYRQLAALFALEGLLSDPTDHSEECQPGETCVEAVARLAVAHADALIKELEK